MPVEKNCLGCMGYMRCRDPQKGYTYSCDEFKKHDGLILDLNTRRNEATQLLDQGDDFDIQSVFDNAIASDTSIPKDIRIDDRDLWHAPNFVEFCTSHKGLKEKPYLRQQTAGTILLSEWCARCSDKEWLLEKVRVDDPSSKFLEKVQLLDQGVCPKCGATKSEMITNKELPLYLELAACVGQRAGKSALVSYLMAYIIHIVLKLQKPNEVYGVGMNNTFHISLVALTHGQAKDLLWDPVYVLLDSSPWFKAYHEMLDQYGKKFGEVYRLQDTFAVYKHRNLTISPQGPDKRKLRGRTRIAASIDEIGWFDNKRDETKVKLNATEIHKALSNSLYTVRAAATRLIEKGYNNVPTGIFMNISSPSNVRDKIMELYNASINSPDIYGIKMPTWEFNPNITREALDSAFRKDPVEAERDFGANPPLSDNPFIGSFPRIELCFKGKRNPVSIKYSRKRMRDGTLTRFARFTSLSRSDEPSVLAIDAGSTSNSFACTVGHLKDGVPVIDLLVEVQPLPSIPINYTKMLEEVLIPLVEQRNVQLVVSDRWQHIKILHDLEATTEVTTIAYSLKYSDIWLLRQMLYDNEVKLPRLEKDYDDVVNYDFDDYPQCFAHDPVSHLVLQAVTVKDTGNQVVKGNNLTDDIFRAVLLNCIVLIGDEYQYVLSNAERQSKPASALGFLRLLTSGGSVSRDAGSTGSDGKALGAMKSRVGYH